MHADVKFLHTADMGHKPTVGFRGTKHVHCVINDGSAVRVVRIDPRDYDKSPPLLLNDLPYPLERIIGQLRTFGQRKGITQQASDLLNVAAAQRDLDENILDALPEDTPEGRAAAELPDPEPEIQGKKSVSPKSDKKPAKASAKPAPAPEPPKPSKTAPRTSNAARSGIIGELCAAYGLDGPKLRGILREAGHRAPYDDKAKLEGSLKQALGK